ncbi:renin receptor-like [Elysia marginata]|uniref:Renin receptor-like n=1 Tax=Elysia marginata TaxID=1093978 RepID=A0AAV4GR22_9GAST|nr:renin receptor-like [Elysia marginata]
MADKMGNLTLLLFGLSSLALCLGQQLLVKHAPSYVTFQQQTPDTSVSSSDLHNILAGPLGLSSKPNSIIQSKSVLKRPKANVLVTVVTHKDQKELPLDSLAKFPLDWDLPFVDVESLMNSVQSKFLEKDPLMLDLVSNNQFFDVKTTSDLFQSLPGSFAAAKDRLLDPDSFLFGSGHKIASLNASLSSDGGLMAELQLMRDVVDKLSKSADRLATGAPDLLSFTLTGLKGISEAYGADSTQTKDAQELVSKHLDDITGHLKKIYKGNVMVEILTVPSIERPNIRKTRSLKAFETEEPVDITDDLKKIYNGNVMVEILTVPSIERPNIRKTRSLKAFETEEPVDHTKLNLALEWDQDFPVTFNICLFLVLTLVIAVLFIAYGIWNMNPNLESILYRVPQDENKKLN